MNLTTCLKLACASLLTSCAMGGIEREEPDYVPEAGIGPFRELAREEVGNSRVAPIVFDDRRAFARDASVIDVDGDPKTTPVRAYLAATVVADDAPEPSSTEATNTLVAVEAADGRSFGRATTPVLSAELEWEGGVLATPGAVRVGKQVFLYYAAAGGIGLARSDDGMAFTREPAPVLAPADASSWEQGVAPTSPSVVRVADGDFRMFYAVRAAPGSAEGARIGEARSSDGVAWTRVGSKPALERDRSKDPNGTSAFDDAGVDAPFAFANVNASGRPTLLLYYAGASSTGARAIGLAGRFSDEDGATFTRAVGPVLTSPTRAVTEPSLVRFEGFTLLFAQSREVDESTDEGATVLVGARNGAGELPPRTDG